MKHWLGTVAVCLAIAGTAPEAVAQQPEWIIPSVLEAAKAEGSVTVYSSINEAEALPYWQLFENATGIKVVFVRGSDVGINARIAIENRARQRSWDLAITSATSQLPPEVLAPYDPPQAAALIPSARAPDRRWYGNSANYNTPAYNTKLVQPSALPKSYAEFATRKEWRGRVAIDGTDRQWLSGMFQHFGADQARSLIHDLVNTLEPVIVEGHLAVARGVGSGEYALALNNFTALTYNVRASGAPIDIFPLDAVTLHVVQVGLNVSAPHPNAALLAANFALSRQAQTAATASGRIPTRPDVKPDPPDAIERMQGRAIVPVSFTADDDRRWKKTFDELFRPR